MSDYKTHRENDLGIGKGWLLGLFTAGVVLFLFFPIIVLIAYSFNESRYVSHWGGFSWKWYRVMIEDRQLWFAIKNSLLIAGISTIVSTVLGTMAALVLGKYVFRGKKLFQNLLYVPIIIPEIIFGIALLIFFVTIHLQLGLVSIVCAHITFSLSFVTLVVLAKVGHFDRSLEEASLDLGANRWQTFYKVVLPGIAPGIVSGALLAFTLSIDDFVITFFTAGAGSATLPLKIYSMIKFGVTPEINAVSTVMILLTIGAVAAVGLLQRSEKWLRRGLRLAYTLLANLFRRPALTALAAALVLTSCSGEKPVAVVQGPTEQPAKAPAAAPEEKIVNVCNWSDYISKEVLREFSDEYGIRVNYDYFSDNEELLAKLKIGAQGYDLIFPTDYMVKTMIEEGLLAPLDLDNIPNASEIDPRFRNLPFDPEGKYSLPYTYGFSGIGYDSNLVPDPVESWDILWNPVYQGKISLLDDMREVFAIAFKRMGYPANEVTEERIAEALQMMIEQKKFLRKYDSTMNRDMLLNGETVLAHIWSGDLAMIAEEKPELRFVVPREGSLMFVDNMCIPANAPHQKNAELLMNFLLKPENAARVINAIYYAMPVPKAMEWIDEEIRNDPAIYPPKEIMDKCEVLRDLGEKTDIVDRAWTELKSR